MASMPQTPWELSRLGHARPMRAYPAEPAGTFAQAVRSLGSQLRREGMRFVALAAARVGAGSTTLAVALAQEAAEAGLRILVIDANLAHPALTEAKDDLVRMGYRIIGEGSPYAGPSESRLWLMPSRRGVDWRGFRLPDGMVPDMILVDGPSLDDPAALEFLLDFPETFLLVARADDDGLDRLNDKLAASPNYRGIVITAAVTAEEEQRRQVYA